MEIRIKTQALRILLALVFLAASEVLAMPETLFCNISRITTSKKLTEAINHLVGNGLQYLWVQKWRKIKSTGQTLDDAEHILVDEIQRALQKEGVQDPIGPTLSHISHIKIEIKVVITWLIFGDEVLNHITSHANLEDLDHVGLNDTLQGYQPSFSLE